MCCLELELGVSEMLLNALAAAVAASEHSPDRLSLTKEYAATRDATLNPPLRTLCGLWGKGGSGAAGYV